MRSVIKEANQAGVDAIVDQQFDYGEKIRAAGLVPILEPEVSIGSPTKPQAEAMLRPTRSPSTSTSSRPTPGSCSS